MKIAAYIKGDMGLCVHMDDDSKAYLDRTLGVGPLNFEVVGSQELRVFRDPKGDPIESKIYFDGTVWAWQRNSHRVKGFHQLVEQGLSEIENMELGNDGSILIRMSRNPKRVRRAAEKPAATKKLAIKRHKRVQRAAPVAPAPVATTKPGEMLIYFPNGTSGHYKFRDKHVNLVNAMAEQLEPVSG